MILKRIDAYAYANRFRAASPSWKSGFAAAAFVLCYIGEPPVQALALGWLAVWTVVYAGTPLRFYAAVFGAACLFYAASVPALVLELGSPPVGAPGQQAAVSSAVVASIGGIAYVTKASLLQAALLLLRSAACTACLLLLMLTTPFTELLQVLRRLRMPQLVLELMLITYRFLFLLSETAEGMVTAQRARGGHQGFRGKLRDTAMLIVRLFAKTMQRYQGVAHGLTARGFTEEIRLAPDRSGPMPKRYRLEGIAGLTLLLLLELWLRRQARGG